MNAVIKPALLPCIPENIPKQLRDAKRWAPWAAPWDPERQKYDKVPHRADRPEAGLSNGSTSGWVSFDRAVEAFQSRPDLFAGVGYLMTGSHGVVGVDLDYCVKDGVVEPWAAEIAAQLDSYTEISPSGTGLHVFVLGDLDKDWSVKLGEKRPKQPGIDVYGGGARFLTVTGAHWAGSPRELRAPKDSGLDRLAAQYRKSKKMADLHALRVPDVHGLELPELEDLGLPYQIMDFLESGLDEGEDRSNWLIRTGAALANADVPPELAFAIMVDNEHTMEVALSKRHYDDTKAREYLWTHHCRRGAQIVEEERILTREAFDVLPAVVAPPASAVDDLSDILGDDPADVFDNLDETEGPVVSRSMAAVGLEQKYRFLTMDEFLRRPAPKWIVKGVLPEAALAVLFGASGSGKTFFALDMCAAIARGQAWNGRKVKRGTVAYVVAEGQGGFRDRADAYCREHGVDRGDLAIRVFPGSINMMRGPEVKLLGESLASIPDLSVIVMDTYARVMGEGNENEAKDVNRVVAHCALLHEVTGAIVLLIHHSGKDSANGARGSSALRAAADVEIEIIRTKAYREAQITKMKDGNDEGKYRFKLNQVVIGLDEDGEDRTSCVIEHLAANEGPEDQNTPASRPRGPVQQRILDLLGEYIGGEVEREAFVFHVRDCTPQPASGKADPNWRVKIEKPLDTLIKEGAIFEVSGVLSLPKGDL